jgi:hypothetical protein
MTVAFGWIERFSGLLRCHGKSLMQALADRGAELILDTDVAELSSLGRFEGVVRRAPWAIEGRPLQFDDRTGARGHERVMQIARFAVEHGFQSVLAPTHLLAGHRDHALDTGLSVLEKLRRALDDVGGTGLALAAFIAAMRGLPFENLWLRIAGFGIDATPVGVLERFDTWSWSKRPEKKSRGGAGTRALVAMLLYQRRAPLEALSRVPESRRAEHYLSQTLTPADR